MKRRSGFTNNPKHVAITVLVFELQNRRGCALLGRDLFLILEGICDLFSKSLGCIPYVGERGCSSNHDDTSAHK